jgi:hypothetical protein
LRFTADLIDFDITVSNIVVVIEVETLQDGPVAEFIKQDLAESVCVALLPLSLRIPHVDAPVLEKL